MRKGAVVFVCVLLCFCLGNSVPEKYFEQNLNHFDYEDHRVWKQRYFESDEYYRAGGPAFIQIGGEAPAGPTWLSKGHWVTIAKDVGAKLYIVEHRFYGKSQPTNDTSVENLKYLTSEQALADLARFIVKMKNATGIEKWVTFGGSYPGSLSVWMKLKYPFLIEGAMSASAPLLAKLDFFEYNEVVNRSLTTYGGSKCVSSLKLATWQVSEMLKTEDGRYILKQIFNLCEPLNENDDQYFQSVIYDPVGETVQYNRDNRAFEGATDGNVTISVLCDHMTDESLGDEVTRYATIPSLFGKYFDRKRLFSRRYKTTNGGGKCVDASYNNFIENLRKPTFSAERTWTFQTCTEFGWFQTTDSKHQPFLGFPVGLFTDMCAKIFGPQFQQSAIEDGIMETNANYGARFVAESVSNVVLFNGGVDPWHAVSYVSATDSDPRIAALVSRFFPKYVNPTFHPLFVPSSAHCAIMYPDHPDDPQELRDARALASKYVKSWL